MKSMTLALKFILMQAKWYTYVLLLALGKNYMSNM